MVDPELHDADLVVLLERPLVRGEERRLDFVYEQEVLNYLPGNSWYPGEADAFLDLYTATLEIKTRKRDDVRAMRELVEEREDDGHPVTTWRIDRPARVVTFSFAEKFFEQSIEVEGVPEVVAFANYGGGKAKKSRTTSPRTSRTASIISSRSSMLPCLSTSFTRRAFWVVTARASTVSSTSPRARFNSNRKDRRSFSVPTRWPINGGVIRWPGKAIATNG